LLRTGPNPPAGADLGALAPQLAEALVSVATDIALVADAAGIVRCVAIGPRSLVPGVPDWIGRAWVDTVAPDCRGKVERMRGEAAMLGVSRRCEISYPTASGEGVPIAWTAMRLGDRDVLLAAGIELRAAAAAQQRLVQVTREVERDRWGWRDGLRRSMAPVAEDLLAQVGTRPFEALLNDASERIARGLLGRALGMAGGDRRRAADLLGIDPDELERRLIAAPIDAGGPSDGRAAPAAA
jgi:hypothetical protein